MDIGHFSTGFRSFKGSHMHSDGEVMVGTCVYKLVYLMVSAVRSDTDGSIVLCSILTHCPQKLSKNVSITLYVQ